MRRPRAGACRLVERMTRLDIGLDRRPPGGAGTSQARHPNRLVGRSQTATMTQKCANCRKLRGSAQTACGTVPRRAADVRTLRVLGRSCSAALLALRLVSAATGAADSSSSPRDHASDAQRGRTPTSRPARAASCSSCTALDARLARERGTPRGRCGSGPPSVQARRSPSHTSACTSHSTRCRSRSGRSRPGWRWLYEQGDTDPWRSCSAQARSTDALGNLDYARPDRRPGPRRDPADAAGQSTPPPRSRGSSRRRSATCSASRSRRRSRRSCSSSPGLERTSYLATLASQQQAERGRDHRVPAAGARGRGKGADELAAVSAHPVRDASSRLRRAGAR